MSVFDLDKEYECLIVCMPPPLNIHAFTHITTVTLFFFSSAQRNGLLSEASPDEVQFSHVFGIT